VDVDGAGARLRDAPGGVGIEPVVCVGRQGETAAQPRDGAPRDDVFAVEEGPAASAPVRSLSACSLTRRLLAHIFLAAHSPAWNPHP
jgi:hypothetical protein